MPLTYEQQRAVESEGKTIVSASAGSGKTKVMIEKILQLIRKGGDIDHILAVTYTKKAAAQMKEKLREKIIDGWKDDTLTVAERENLKKQLNKIANADISTVHSFCAKLIRTHFFLLDVDANFRIIGEDGVEGAELFDKAMELVFEEGYEKKEEEFLELVSLYWKSKKDNELRELIKKIYQTIRIYDGYQAYLQPEFVRGTKEKFERICSALFNTYKEKVSFIKKQVEEVAEFFDMNGCEHAFLNAKDVLVRIDGFLQKKELFSALEYDIGTYIKAKPKTKEPILVQQNMERLKDLKKDFRDFLSKQKSGLKGKEEEFSRYMQATKTVEYLAKYTLRFEEIYTQLKRSKNALDYNDLEHFAIALLSREDIQREMHEKYEYVFVDEYQDVNPVQEKLIESLAGDNVFLVGDIKQAIYGFRGSKSYYFAEKEKNYQTQEGASALMLGKNFRSSKGVLNCVNDIFEESMTAENSSVDYRKNGKMEGGDLYSEHLGLAQMHLIDVPKKEKKERGVYSVEQAYLEGRKESSYFAQCVCSLVEKEHNSTWYDVEEEEEEKRVKRVEYRDIAILSRKLTDRAKKTIFALVEAGIPVTSSLELNVCEYPEIKTLIDILSLIDNKEQDIPLCSALLSAMGNMTTEELTKIRLAYPKEEFYRNCCKAYAEEKLDEIAHKLRAFYSYYERIRKYSMTADAGEVIFQILRDTKMEEKLLQKPNGLGCLERIHYFISQTTQNEPLCVHEFLEVLASLNYTLKQAESGGENAVKVLTMHASKGLEYPVVIIDDLSATYEGKNEYILHFDEEFGVCVKCMDKKSYTILDTVLWKYCTEKEKREEVKNELNVFYVALTRAKYRLHLLFSKEPQKYNTHYGRYYAEFVPKYVYDKYKCEDLLLPQTKRGIQPLVGKADEEVVNALRNLFLWQYPFHGGENLPVKTSASQRLKEEKEEYFPSAPLIKEDNGSGEGDATLIGLAYHAFLEHFDFYAHSVYGGGIENSLSKMKEAGVEEGYFALLQREKLEEIIRLPIFSEIAAKRLYKEQTFLVGLPAKEVYEPSQYGNMGEEEILFQGAIDLLAIGEEEATILDYKYSSAAADTLKRRYKLQLDLYRKTVAKLLHLPLNRVRAVIVNIQKGFSIEV